MKNNYLAILLVFITSVCFAGGPEPVVNVNANQIADGSVTASKLASSDDYAVNSMTLTEKVQAAWADIRGDIYASGSLEVAGNADIGGDLTGVDASFSGNVNAPFALVETLGIRSTEGDLYCKQQIVELPDVIGAAASYTVDFSILSDTRVSMETTLHGFESTASVYTLKVIDSFYLDASSGLNGAVQTTIYEHGTGNISIAWSWVDSTTIRATFTNNSSNEFKRPVASFKMLTDRASQIGVK